MKYIEDVEAYLRQMLASFEAQLADEEDPERQRFVPVCSALSNALDLLASTPDGALATLGFARRPEDWPRSLSPKELELEYVEHFWNLSVRFCLQEELERRGLWVPRSEDWIVENRATDLIVTLVRRRRRLPREQEVLDEAKGQGWNEDDMLRLKELVCSDREGGVP